MCKTKKEKGFDALTRSFNEEDKVKEVSTINVEVPLTGLSIIYNGELWYTLDTMAIHEGLTRRGVEQRCARGYYESVRTCGILIWRKKQEA